MKEKAQKDAHRLVIECGLVAESDGNVVALESEQRLLDDDDRQAGDAAVLLRAGKDQAKLAHVDRP